VVQGMEPVDNIDLRQMTTTDISAIAEGSRPSSVLNLWVSMSTGGALPSCHRRSVQPEFECWPGALFERRHRWNVSDRAVVDRKIYKIAMLTGRTPRI
jgi:hypothetical protein